MPKLEISLKDLERLAGKSFNTTNELEEALMFAKAELDEGKVEEGDAIKADAKDTNRPDMWSVEGLAREIAGRFGKKGCPKYKVNYGKLKIIIDSKAKKTRPYAVAAIVRNLRLTNEIILQMIQLQDKIDTTFGRNRKEVAIGVYDVSKIKSPVTYTTVKPNGIKFKPLGKEGESYSEMTPAEIMEKHPKGKEYKHLLDGMDEYPIFIDANKEVLSLPPIINSNFTGRVTDETKDVLIECTGYNLKYLLPALNSMVAAMADRGGIIESVQLNYPDNYDKTVKETPDMNPKKLEVSIKKIKDMIGIDVSDKDIVELLEKARYDVKLDGDKLKLEYPCYRQDIMHWRDVLEDVLISYGYNNVNPRMREMTTRGAILKENIFCDKISEILVGMGLQEVLSYNLTNKKALFDKMRLKTEKIAEIENAVSETWSVFRSWLLPSVLDFLSKNKHNEYPQNVFEIGDTVVIDEKAMTKTRDVRKLCIAITDTEVNYNTLASQLDALMRSIGLTYVLEESDHASFLNGRLAAIVVKNKRIGMMGELHPQTLNNWELETPTMALELDVSELFKLISK